MCKERGEHDARLSVIKSFSCQCHRPNWCFSLQFWRARWTQTGKSLPQDQSLSLYSVTHEWGGWTSGENHQCDAAFCPLKDGNGFFVGYPFQALPVDSDDLITPFQTPIFRGCSLQWPSRPVYSENAHSRKRSKPEFKLLRMCTHAALGAPWVLHSRWAMRNIHKGGPSPKWF